MCTAASRDNYLDPLGSPRRLCSLFKTFYETPCTIGFKLGLGSGRAITLLHKTFIERSHLF